MFKKLVVMAVIALSSASAIAFGDGWIGNEIELVAAPDQSVALEPKVVYQQDRITFLYVKGEMPKTPSFTIDIPAEKALKMSDREQQVKKLFQQVGSPELVQFCDCLKDKASTSAFFMIKGMPFGVDVVFEEQKTVVTMYGQWEEAPKNVVRMARTCVQQRGWFVLNGSRTLSNVGLLGLATIVVIGLVAVVVGAGQGADDPSDMSEPNIIQKTLSYSINFVTHNSHGSTDTKRILKFLTTIPTLFFLAIVFSLIDSKIQD